VAERLPREARLFPGPPPAPLLEGSTEEVIEEKLRFALLVALQRTREGNELRKGE